MDSSLTNNWANAVVQFLIIILALILAWILVTIKSLHSAHLFTAQELTENNEEWWERNKSGRYSRLLVPPDCINPDCPRSDATSLTPVVQTKRLMKGMYRAAVGSSKFKYQRLGWSVNKDHLPEGIIPVLCFVNSKSGGQQGAYFQYELKQLLNPIQVVDLSDIDPLVALRAFADFDRFRVLIAGGDGTVGWVLGAIDELGLAQPPPIAILPIGTGNDLANELGWLSVLRNSTLTSIMEKVQNAQSVTLDRWTFTQQPNTTAVIRSSSSNKSLSSSGKQQQQQLTSIAFQNYCGVGVDAQIALQFHTLRSSSPNMFFHSYVNKFWYGFMGYCEWWRRATPVPFCRQIELICDDKVVTIPADALGIVFLNIVSYGGGSTLWSPSQLATISDDSSSSDGTTEANNNSRTRSNRVYADEDSDYEFGGRPLRRRVANNKSSRSSPNKTMTEHHANKRKWLTPSSNDGLLEVVAVKSSLELAQIKLGITSCQKLAQGKSFQLRLHNALPMQFDGEPRMQSSGMFTITVKEQQAVMLKPVPDDMDLDLVEVLEWASRQHVITNLQQEMIMSEYIKRVERRRWRDVQWS